MAFFCFLERGIERLEKLTQAGGKINSVDSFKKERKLSHQNPDKIPIYSQPPERSFLRIQCALQRSRDPEICSWGSSHLVPLYRGPLKFFTTLSRANSHHAETYNSKYKFMPKENNWTREQPIFTKYTLDIVWNPNLPKNIFSPFTYSEKHTFIDLQ